MCFTLEITTGMAALNLGVGLLLHKRGSSLARTQVRRMCRAGIRLGPH
jgi:hypothetical protein